MTENSTVPAGNGSVADTESLAHTRSEVGDVGSHVLSDQPVIPEPIARCPGCAVPLEPSGWHPYPGAPGVPECSVLTEHGQLAGFWSQLDAERAATIPGGRPTSRPLRAVQPDERATGPASTWAPVDLTDILAGKRARVVPELGARNDGVPLLYRGKEHSIASEPECGKTWWMALQVAHVLKSGGRVVWVEFEDDPETVVGERLMSAALGLLAGRLTRVQFCFSRPETPYRGAEYLDLLRFDDGAADLVVFDGVTEGMHLFGLDPMNQNDAAKWRHILIKPALKLGSATVASDHVVKDKTQRGRYSIGAQHKLAGLTGAAFQMEQVEPFGRGLKGRSRVTITKDRNGGLRQHGKPIEGEPGMTHLGDLVGDATSGDMAELIFWPPFEDTDADANGSADPAADQKVIKAAGLTLARLKKLNREMGITELRDSVKVRRADVRPALEWLETMGCIDKRGSLYQYRQEPESWD